MLAGSAVVSVLSLLLPVSMTAQVNVRTANYGTARTNANLNETILNTANVNADQFGRLASLPVDGQILAQPLYASGLQIPGRGALNVLFVATLHNSVYAFDADSLDRSPIWRVSLGPPVPTANYNMAGGAVYRDIIPEVGILSTPVIDPNTGTLYAVAATFDNGVYAHSLHALDIQTGDERAGSPVRIEVALPGTAEDSEDGVIPFRSYSHLQRAGLLLADGLLYLGFGSHGSAPPYHGWILAYDAADLRQVAALNTTPDGQGGSVWQAGRGMAADDEGAIYAVTANGDNDGYTNLAQSFLKFGRALSLHGWYTPIDWESSSSIDLDLGSSGAILIPGTNYLVAGGKDGTLYLLDRTQMADSAIGEPGPLLDRIQAVGRGIFTMALWNHASGPIVYVEGWDEGLKAYRITGDRFSRAPIAVNSRAFHVPYQGLAVSANGSEPGTGILWMTAMEDGIGGPGTLRALDAADISRELWNSAVDAPDTSLGAFAKFVAPTIANGRVYVPTGGHHLAVYGLKAGPAARPELGPITVVNSASLAGDAVAPGEAVTIFGTAIGPETLETFTPDVLGRIPTQLAGTVVYFGNAPAPLTYVSSGRIDAVVPYAVAGGSRVRIQVEYLGARSEIMEVDVVAAHPGVFTADGSAQALVLNDDLTANSPANPAARGSTVTLRATGQGQMTPPADGIVIAQNASYVPGASVSVLIDGQEAEVVSAGGVPGSPSALLEIKARVPETATPGDSVTVVLTIANISSPTVTVAVK